MNEMVSAEVTALESDQASMGVRKVKRPKSLWVTIIALFVSSLLALGATPTAFADDEPIDDDESGLVVPTEEELDEEGDEEVAEPIDLVLVLYGTTTYKWPIQKQVGVGEQFGPLPSPTRTNYTFKGWYLDLEDSESRVISTTIVEEDFEGTLYALWVGKTIKVTFKPNKGKVSKVSKKVQHGSTYGTMPKPTRKGYQFTGWYTKASGGTKVTATTKVTSTKDRSLYAHWQVPKYKIKFDARDGTASPIVKTKTLK